MVIGIAQEFAQDLHDLLPVSKLQGINANRESRSRLPNLVETTVDYSDDLVMAIDELLNPPAEISESPSWINSRMRIIAVLKII